MPNQDPYRHIERAPYALPEGVPALQQDPRMNRRRLLALSLGAGLLAGSAAFWLGRRSAPSPVLEPAPSLVLWARKLAEGDLDRLVRSAPTFLLTIEEFGGDPTLWSGVARIAGHAQDLRSDDSERERLERRVLVTLHARAAELPGPLQEQRQRLMARYPTESRRR